MEGEILNAVFQRVLLRIKNIKEAIIDQANDLSSPTLYVTQRPKPRYQQEVHQQGKNSETQPLLVPKPRAQRASLPRTQCSILSVKAFTKVFLACFLSVQHF